MLNPTPQEKDLARIVCAKWDLAEKHHQRFRKQCDHLYGLWAGYTSWKNDMQGANPRDRDVGLQEAKRQFGADLFIPITLATVESVIPRMLSNRPQMLIKPDDRVADQNVDPMKHLIDRQQEQIEYELVLQDVAKYGQVLNLGVQKTYWKTKQINVPTLERKMYDTTRWVPGQGKTITTFDDPFAEAIDPRDFLWDPFAHDLESADFVFHRTWRPMRYVMRMIEQGLWFREHQGVNEQDIKALLTNRWSETRAAQLRANNMPTLSDEDQPVEVREFHDGEHVVTVIGLDAVAQYGGNPTPRGEYPFQIYRPSKHPLEQFVGMGVVQPAEDLQRELNTMRSQRRDNATISLNAPLAFQTGLIEPEDLQFGPGIAIPVNGDPREILMQLQVKDIPNSGYMEEDRLLADMMRATGMDDSQQGVSSGDTTATEAQIVQNAASLRIQLQTRRLEVEVIKKACQQWVWLNQIKIRQARDIRIPIEQPSPETADRRWTWETITPDQLMGEFKVEVEGGSTQPDNVPMKRQDGQALATLLGNNPHVDQSRLIAYVLDKFDVKAPQEWLVQAPHIPPAFLTFLPQALQRLVPGLDPAMLQNVIGQAMQAAQQQEQAGIQNPSGPTQVESVPPALSSPGGSPTSRNGSGAGD